MLQVPCLKVVCRHPSTKSAHVASAVVVASVVNSQWTCNQLTSSKRTCSQRKPRRLSPTLLTANPKFSAKLLWQCPLQITHQRLIWRQSTCAFRYLRPVAVLNACIHANQQQWRSHCP